MRASGMHPGMLPISAVVAMLLFILAEKLARMASQLGLYDILDQLNRR